MSAAGASVGDTTIVSDPVMMATAGATGKETIKPPKKKERHSKRRDGSKSRHHHHHRRRSSSSKGHQHKRSSSATATGAAAGEPKSKKRSKRSKSEGGGRRAGVAVASNIVAVPAAPPLFDDAPLVTDDNMAGYVDRVARSLIGVQSRLMKTATPNNQSKLVHESFLHFTIRSSNDEHIRFRPNALTLMLFASYANQDEAAKADNADQKVEKTAKRHALRAVDSKPFMFLDPSVGATSFFSHVEVLVDNVPINSSYLMGGLWLQYARVCEIFTNAERVRLRSNKDLNPAKMKDSEYQALREAVLPFSYGSWNTTTGRRVEANLRGAFPFEFKNQAAAAGDNLKEPNYTFPPNTTFDFRFHFHPDKFAAVFHPTIASNMTEYMNLSGDAPHHGVADYKNYDIAYTISQAFLEYEVIVLRPQQSIEYLEKMRAGSKATYRYDVVRGQHVTMPKDQSYVDVPFTIAPFARLLYVLFLPDWAVMSMPALRRPLSGFSSFPAKCTELSMLFAGQKPLITPSFERLGFTGEQHHSSQRTLFHYLTSNRVWPGTFDELFPPTSDIEPFNQMLYVDLRESMSNNAENLNVRCTFAAGSTSPSNRQIVVLSVHSTGEVQCSHAGSAGHYDWRWESKY